MENIMSAQATKILEKAMKLTPAERADLAACLLASLNDKALAKLDPAWEAEIEERLQAIDSGKAKLIPWQEARKRILRDA
jgi:putative addiction module component (TIGR02574 family)